LRTPEIGFDLAGSAVKGAPSVVGQTPKSCCDKTIPDLTAM